MSWLQSIQSMLPRPERRSEGQVNDDLADEFAFHLEQSERAIIAQGEPPQDAAAIARQRFGDIGQITRRCRRIALEERIMLQRFNAVMMVVVGLLVAGLAVQVWNMQRDNTRALQQITTQISQIRAGGDGGAVQASSTAAADRGTVYVSGAVARGGGVFALPSGELTLSKLMVMCSPMSHPDSVEVRRRVDGKMESQMVDLKDAAGGDFVLRAGDEIRVPLPEATKAAAGGESGFASAIPIGGGQPNIWLQLDQAGKPIDHVRLELLERGDIRNLSGAIEGRLTDAKNYRGTLELRFRDGLGTNLDIHTMPKGLNYSGRWTYENGTLTINTADAIKEFPQPLRFSRLAAVDLDALKSREKARADLTNSQSRNLAPSGEPISGLWRELDADGKPFDAGAQLVMMGMDDERNIFGKSGPVFVLRAESEEIGIDFKSQDLDPNLIVHQPTPGVANQWDTKSGRWEISPDGELTLDVTQAIPSRSTPIRMRRIGDLPATVYMANPASNGGGVLVRGDIVRPGRYTLPAVAQLSLRRLFASAGGKRDAGPVAVTVSTQGGVERFRHDDLFASATTDCLVKPGDVITFRHGGGKAPDFKPAAGGPDPNNASTLVEIEKAKAQAMADFLKQVRATSGQNGSGAASGVATKEALDRAADEIEARVSDQPDVLKAVRESIAQVRKSMEDSVATSQPAKAPD